MITAITVAASMCLQGGSPVDISPYVPAAAAEVELKVTMTSPTGVLIVYSPGYEAQQVRFTKLDQYGRVQFAEPVLCIKAEGGPFEFNMQVRWMANEE
jgi:hypothetical protein